MTRRKAWVKTMMKILPEKQKLKGRALYIKCRFYSYTRNEKRYDKGKRKEKHCELENNSFFSSSISPEKTIQQYKFPQGQTKCSLCMWLHLFCNHFIQILTWSILFLSFAWKCFFFTSVAHKNCDTKQQKNYNFPLYWNSSF